MKRTTLSLCTLLLALTAWAQNSKPTAGVTTTQPTAAATAPAETATSNQMSLPQGTAVKMKLETAISTSTNKAGDSFSGRVTEPVVLEGKTVIPVGASIQGRVAKVSEPRRIKGLPTIDLHPESITMPDGERYNLNAVVVDTNKANHTEVNDEGQIKGSGINRRDKLEMGAGAGAGLTIGALAGGGKGALIGTAIGGGAAVTHWLMKHKSTEVPAGTEIVMEISRPLALSAGGAASK